MADRETPARAEAAAIRRRWITLGEVLAVAAVAISGLTLWNSYSERNSAQAERAAAKQQAASKAAVLVLRSERTDEGKRLLLAPADAQAVIQSQTFLFPSALGIDGIDTVVEPRIEADWIEDGVKKGARGSASGDRLLPVAISTRFTSDGATRSHVALYDIGYELEGGGFLAGREVRLRGLSLLRRVPQEEAQARLDALWQSRRPAEAKE